MERGGTGVFFAGNFRLPVVGGDGYNPGLLCAGRAIPVPLLACVWRGGECLWSPSLRDEYRRPLNGY